MRQSFQHPNLVLRVRHSRDQCISRRRDTRSAPPYRDSLLLHLLDSRVNRYQHWTKHNAFYGLAITTVTSALLLAADSHHWTVAGHIFYVVTSHRASVGLAVQLLSGILGLLHVTAVCRLINYATRLRFNKSVVTLDVLRAWVDMSIPRLDWDLPLRFFFPVLIIVSFGLVPSALWAGAITPILTGDTTVGTLQLPSYANIFLIKEYPSELTQGGPSLRNQQGFFTYNVGTQLIGDILSSAASATTIDNSVRQHSKFDNTQFSYIGRSYGVGGSVGLGDQSIRAIPQATGYSYEESGYLANVACIYNSSSDFLLTSDRSQWMFIAGGNLPDSVESPEYSNYVGHNMPQSYAFLNTTQCSFDFTPTLFNISVNLPNRTIAVTPGPQIPDFNPDRNITRTVVRQFELLSNDLTNLYVSLLGAAFNSSIAAYNMSESSSNKPITEADATLAGLTNSITAMVDDMLAAYSTAQLIVGGFSVPQTASVQRSVLRFGLPAYIYSIFGLNLAVLLAVALEARRTEGWKRLSKFDYLDPRDLVVAASRGGTGVAGAVERMEGKSVRWEKEKKREKKREKKMWLFSNPDEGIGEVPVRLVAEEEGRFEIVLGRERGDVEVESKVNFSSRV
ncbi:hypothetical protein K432DRAFT_455416 [Lepidopterella palustris CBS 459.81]|uniref:Uncharacterized protein n=1 Tax=Lepidopterella palustris CBS 459.81 TaxID=1314670 RepID=A0A8E2JEF5_9PEZI|nr:hypothetical protein K432DRAFT_455416 [Lepidopterella palustris CBS 459.81]